MVSKIKNPLIGLTPHAQPPEFAHKEISLTYTESTLRHTHLFEVGTACLRLGAVYVRGGCGSCEGWVQYVWGWVCACEVGAVHVRGGCSMFEGGCGMFEGGRGAVEGGCCVVRWVLGE